MEKLIWRMRYASRMSRALPVGWRWAWIMSGDSWEDNDLYYRTPKQAVNADIRDWFL